MSSCCATRGWTTRPAGRMPRRPSRQRWQRSMTRASTDWKVTGEFVSRSPTPPPRTHFARWLEERVHAAGTNTKVCFKSEKLRELNDTEGIYACAMDALDFAAKADGEKLVTLYLSPGTPVMAFVWALAATAASGPEKTAHRLAGRRQAPRGHFFACRMA